MHTCSENVEVLCQGPGYQLGWKLCWLLVSMSDVEGLTHAQTLLQIQNCLPPSTAHQMGMAHPSWRVPTCCVCKHHQCTMKQTGPARLCWLKSCDWLSLANNTCKYQASWLRGC